MEYIHKAKAEKTRTKVLTDQMEARRVKNKVRCTSRSPPGQLADANLRLLASVGQHVLRRSGQPLSLWSKKLPRSKYTHHDSPFICLAIDRPAACLPHRGTTLFLQSRFPIYCILCHACSQQSYARSFMPTCLLHLHAKRARRWLEGSPTCVLVVVLSEIVGDTSM